MRTLMTAVLALGLMAFAASAARAGTYACVNNSSGEVKVVPSCTVGTNDSPCHKNDICVDLSLISGEYESWESCDESLCLDTPHPDGTGGWGHVTSLTVGVDAGLNVTVLQPSGACDDGTITLTWRSQDFSFVGANNGSCSYPFPEGPTGPLPDEQPTIVSCSYTNLGHTAKSVTFTFTPQNPTDRALVTATVRGCGERASETFPVAIVNPVP
jgi:hypothetical protein